MGLHLPELLSGLTPLLLYIAGLAVFFASAFWRPEIGIYYIVPLLPLQTIRYRIHQFPLGAQWIDLMLLGVLIGVLRKGNSVFSDTPLKRRLFALAVLSYVSLWQGAIFLNFPLPFWFDDVRLSDWKNYMVIFLLFFLVLASIRTVKQMQILLFVMCLSMLALNRNYIGTMRQRDFSAFSYDIRDEGSMGYAGVNGLAAVEAQFSVFLLGLYSVHKKILPKIGYLVLLGSSLVSLTYTLSRGGYAAVLVGALFVGIVKNRKLILVLALFLCVWQTIVPNAVRERVFMTRDNRGQLDPSAGDRVTLWENAVEIIKGNPVIGTGFDTYKFMHAVGPYEDTHNYYIKVMLEMGIVGLIVFLGIISRMFAAGYGLFRTVAAEDFLRGVGLGLAGMVVATVVANAFGDRWTYIEETGSLWVFAAMAVRGKMLADEKIALEETSGASENARASDELENASDLNLAWNSRSGAR
jgi:putative inorganic carbon (HCO3(-)) transporter